MSAFVKNYYSPKNKDVFLSVSWETGYRNIQVYYKNRLVHSIGNPAVLVEGIKIEDQELGTIKFRFTTQRPRKLEIKINNKKFKTVNKRDLGYDYTGLITIFTGLCVFAAMETVMLGGSVGFEFSHPVIITYFTLGILISITYGVISYLLSKKVNWTYFLGAFIFTITSIDAIANIVLIGTNYLGIVFLIIRLGMLLYIYLQLKHVLKEMRKVRGSNEVDGLLDN